MKECPVCHKVGFHKMSCTNNTARVAIPMRGGRRRCKAHVWRKDYLNGGKKCQVCGKAQQEVERSKDV